MGWWEACGWVTGKSGKRGIPVPELKSDGKSDCSISLMLLHVKTARALPSSVQIFREIMV